ncbi:TonB-dependent receptor [Thermonema rossianum]|uniref:TonB-dependent receptor n=1 Tax=Thermonema rossianum TaxID=55505 RepID=UPI00068E763A|nr:TonB-dependent receptor [Thermonema rossianum]
MKHKLQLFILSLLVLMPGVMVAQTGTWQGVVIEAGTQAPVAFAQIFLPSTKTSIIADEQGRFAITIDSLTFPLQVVCMHVGYHPAELKLLSFDDLPRHIILQPLSLEEVVVSGSRFQESIHESAIKIETIQARQFEAVQASSLLDGLSFQSGVRTEIDCQTCNYSQVRINGLGGAYSQILWNSRPIFSNLLGLYGLEQLPASMIERVEVVRGGGSVTYGANAIAGTLNIITRRPTGNDYEISTYRSWIGNQAADDRLQASVSHSAKKSGWLLASSMRRREAFDANGDGFSEIPQIRQQSHLLSGYIDPGSRHEFNIHLMALQEERHGGDRLHLPPHERQQSEWRNAFTLAGAVDWNFELSPRHQMQAFVAWQQTGRQHYTGYYGSEGYGNTDNLSYQSGWQHLWLSPSLRWRITNGIEWQGEKVLDQIPSCNYLINQHARLWGWFTEIQWQHKERWKIQAGQRISYHNLAKQWYWTPRASVRFQADKHHILRATYSQGFRPPQAFDADMHIAFAGGGIARIQIDPGLQSEHARSAMLSIDADYPHTHYIAGFSLSGFYTHLRKPFTLEELGTTSTQELILLRSNGSDALVYGLSIEARANLREQWELRAAYTIQRSYYAQAVAWSAEHEPVKEFLRTPNHYGYWLVEYVGIAPWKVSFAGTYTGPMWIPHFAGAEGVTEDKLTRSPAFFDTGFQIGYEWHFDDLPRLSLSAGVQNIFNAYQRDFDKGAQRDSNYIYGPGRPRTFQLSLRLRP